MPTYLINCRTSHLTPAAPDMLEGRERTITIHGCCGEVLGALLRFMYCCECSLPPGRLVALTALADQYDVLLLTELCREAIRGHLHNQR
jgi:hypothetical protein